MLKNLKPGDRFFCDMVSEVHVFRNVKREFVVMDTSVYNIDFGNDNPEDYQTCIMLCTGEPYSFDKEDEVEVEK